MAVVTQVKTMPVVSCQSQVTVADGHTFVRGRDNRLGTCVRAPHQGRGRDLSSSSHGRDSAC